MDAQFLYWCGALLNMAVMFGFIVTGVRQVRRREIAKHRRSMLIAISLVVGFLASFVLKSRLLGREDFSMWSEAAVFNLRFHETCVLVMLLAGGFALWRARRMKGTRHVTREPADAWAPADVVRWHKRAGWTVVASAALGLLTAGLVLAGMYTRLP